MAESHTWAIVDAIPEGGTIVEWGAGGSTLFWLENHETALVQSIESEEKWQKAVETRVRDNKDFQSRLDVALTSDLIEYTMGAYFPVDQADVILIDGINRKLSTAYATTVAKPGCRLFVHDTQDVRRYGWILQFMERHPDWALVDTLYPLPEDRMKKELLTTWVRL